MKDLFSSASRDYAHYRPGYPAAFFDYLDSLLTAKQNAWDCGTGNGQVAMELAKTFEAVYATDISAAQLQQAPPADTIFYSVQAAESPVFEDAFFDLIVVAQAVHWFHFEQFYAAVRRTARKGAWLCLLGYGRPTIMPAVDALITDFYKNTIGTYWDSERHFIDEQYQTLPFPFPEIQTPAFENRLHWGLPQLVGYLNTWSAVKHFIKKNGYNPVSRLQPELEKCWPAKTFKDVCFPLLLRVGKMPEN